MSKVLLIDIGGTNLRYAYSEGNSSELYDTNKIELSCIKGFDTFLHNLVEGHNVDDLVISVAGPKINGSITMTNRDFSINEWLLYDMESPSASNSRGFARGSIFKKDGTMVASVAQEGLMRKLVKQ